MRFKPAGRSHFFEDDQRSLGDGLALWYGYQQSLRLSQSGMTLNLDMTGTAFYDSGWCVSVSACANKSHVSIAHAFLHSLQAT